jgi:hypothetical protein
MSDNKTQAPGRPADRWTDVVTGLTNARRDFAELSLNAFEQTADRMLEHERKLAEAIPLDWLREAMIVRTSVLTEAKAAYLRVARSLVQATAPTTRA